MRVRNWLIFVKESYRKLFEPRQSPLTTANARAAYSAGADLTRAGVVDHRYRVQVPGKQLICVSVTWVKSRLILTACMAAMGFGLVMGTSRWSRTRRLHSLCAKGSPLVYEEVPREPEDGQFVIVETASYTTRRAGAWGGRSRRPLGRPARLAYRPRPFAGQVASLFPLRGPRDLPERLISGRDCQSPPPPGPAFGAYPRKP